jgi:acetylornithine deacetylase/succinyl-diaminopimelate desuccinylase-like protein
VTEAVRARVPAAVVPALERLVAFLRIPSVSTDPAHAGDMERAARFAAGLLAEAGFPAVEVLPTGGPPAVWAAWTGRPGAPTVLVYGHYDVQPADPLDAWVTPPFEPTVREGRLYARGASDDKGPVVQALEAARLWLETTGELPLNVLVLLEGEEEVGSPHLATFLAAQRDRLRADVVVSADGAMWRVDEPSLIVGAKGLVSLAVTVVTAAADLHSGRHGGAAPNAVHALARLIASLHDEDGRVAVPGFYARVRPPAPEERAAWARLALSEEAYRCAAGVRGVIGEGEYTVAERLFARPALDVNGVTGGYGGPGSKTVIPSRASMTLSCRLVPDQSPAEVAKLVARHLTAKAPFGAEVTVEVLPGMAAPYLLPPDTPALAAAEAALRRAFGQAPLYVRMGGTLPAADHFRRVLGLATVFFSFSTADERFHAPNEFFRLERFELGLAAWVELYAAMAEHLRARRDGRCASST